MITIQQPNISASTPQEQLQQMRSYMYQLSRELQWAFSTLDTSGSSGSSVITLAPELQQIAGTSKAEQSFSEVKDLIIKSADIVSALGDQIDRKLSGKYVAQSVFGDYVRETDATITETSQNTTANYREIQQIIETMAESNAYIRSGKLSEENGMPVFGLEIGQTNEIGGTKTFAAVARFTPNKLSFFDSSGIEVAYISNQTLHITQAEISGDIILSGKFRVFWDDGLAFQYVGDGG